MISGVFVNNNVPVIPVLVAWGQAAQVPRFILDTGFTGDLQVTPEIAKELGLKVTGVTKARIANGQTVAVPTALALASMEGATNYVQVLISDSSPLAGISFLTKFAYKATIDCKLKTVTLERVV